MWKASTSHRATFKAAAKQLEGSCGEGFEGYGGFEGARRQSRRRKKELCARLQQPAGKATAIGGRGPQLEKLQRRAGKLQQLEGAAARGSKGTEVLKGPGGSLGSVRRTQ